MVIAGDIRLGNSGDMRDYLLVNPTNFHAEAANPLSPRLNTGEKYAELSGWAEHASADWQAGVGRTKPEDGGFLFGTNDTRVPNQIILPQAMGGSTMWGQTSNGGAGYNLPWHASEYTSITLTASSDYARVGVKMGVLAAGVTGVRFSVLVMVSETTSLQAALAPDNSGNPNIPIGSSNVTLTPAPYPQWITFTFANTLTAGTIYWVYLTPGTNSLDLIATTSWDGGVTKRYDQDVTAWVSMSTHPVFVTDLMAQQQGDDGFFSFTRSPQRLTGLIEDSTNARVYNTAYNSSSNAWATPTSSTTLTANKTVLTAETYNIANSLDVPAAYKLEIQGNGISNISDAAPYLTISNADSFVSAQGTLFDGYIYVALGDTYVPLEAGTGGGAPVTGAASSFASWRGYLWRGADANVYYSNDGSTWSTAIKIGSDDYLVRGMAGLETGIHAATDEGLFFVGDGDIVFGITPWGTRAVNEVRMLNHQSALCVPIAGRIWRMSGDGNFMDIWISRDDDLPAQLLGSPKILASMNHWLLAAVDAGDDETSSVWAWQTEGWHSITDIPKGFRPTALYYDRELARLWIGTTGSFAFYVNVDDNAINPYNSTSSRFAPYGWTETPKFYGDLIKMDKDFESVFVTGDFPTGTSAKIYYQSDQISDWTLLGTVTADNTELVWSNYTLRPSGKWIKLGYLLTTTDPTVTPRITAVVTKYMPNVTDRERWTLPLMLADYQEMRDGSVSTYTSAQQLAHLKALVKQVQPFTFEDFDGTEYTVKATGASRQLYHYDQTLVEAGVTQSTTVTTTVAVKDGYQIGDGAAYFIADGVQVLVGFPEYEGVTYGRRTLEWVYTIAIEEL